MRASIRHGLLAFAFVGTYGFTHAVGPVAPAVPAALGDLPMAFEAWAGMDAPALPPDVVSTLAADEFIRRYYRGEPGAVEMDVAYYAQPRIGANMHSPLNCLPGNGWQIARIDSVPLDGAPDVRVRSLTVQRGLHKFAMAYWFQSRNRVITGEASARFHLLADALQRRPTDAGVVRVMAPITEGTSAETAVLAFASRLVPELAKIFRGV